MARFCFSPRACWARPRHLLSVLTLVAVSSVTTAPAEPVPVASVSPVLVSLEELMVRPLKPEPQITCEKRRYYYFYCGAPVQDGAMSGHV